LPLMQPSRRTDDPVAKIVPDTPPTFAYRSLRSRLRLASRVTRAASKVVHRSAQREGGRIPLSPPPLSAVWETAAQLSPKKVPA